MDEAARSRLADQQASIDEKLAQGQNMRRRGGYHIRGLSPDQQARLAEVQATTRNRARPK